jgi:hypothetical protein
MTHFDRGRPRLLVLLLVAFLGACTLGQNQPEQLRLRVLPDQTEIVYINPNNNDPSIWPLQLRAAGGQPFGGYDWSVAYPSTLPFGIALDPQTGVLSASGGASHMEAGVYEFTAEVSDCDAVAEAVVRVRVAYLYPTPYAFATQGCMGEVVIDDAVAGKPYGYSLFALGGYPPYRWRPDPSYQHSDDIFMSGLAVDEVSGVVYGTPMAAAAGRTFSFKLILQDSKGNYGVEAPVYKITVD